MNSTNLNKSVEVELNIGNELTTISCGHLVVELVKFIAYQRLQIPYSYQWLKQIINRKKECENRKESFHSERHFHTASTALSNLDFILKSLSKEVNSAIKPEEICIMLGASPYTCKEIYRLLLPDVCHKPQCQSKLIANDQKLQRTVFRMLATSEQLGSTFFSALAPTNMYIFIKKKILSNQKLLDSDDFVLFSGCRIPKSCKVVNIDFRSKNVESIECCNNFQVFGDVLSENLNNLSIEVDNDEFCEMESTEDKKWFQSSYVMKGFKDLLVNGSSVTNSWLSS